MLNTFVEIEILVGLIGGLSSVVLFLLFESVYSFQFILYLLVFVTGCLVGLEIPLLMNILKDKVQFRDLVSNVFTFDYIEHYWHPYYFQCWFLNSESWELPFFLG
jgi:spermidine synthase